MMHHLTMGQTVRSYLDDTFFLQWISRRETVDMDTTILLHVISYYGED